MQSHKRLCLSTMVIGQEVGLSLDRSLIYHRDKQPVHAEKPHVWNWTNDLLVVRLIAFEAFRASGLHVKSMEKHSDVRQGVPHHIRGRFASRKCFSATQKRPHVRKSALYFMWCVLCICTCPAFLRLPLMLTNLSFSVNSHCINQSGACCLSFSDAVTDMESQNQHGMQ